MDQITVSNINIDVVHKPIKNIHLAVYPPNGRVRIAAPLNANPDTIRLYAISKLAWIKKHQRNFESQDRLPPREFKNRESHYFRGKRYLLNIIEAEAKPKVVLRNKTLLDIYVRPGTPTVKSKIVLNAWYRQNLKSQIPELIAKWEKKLGVRVNDWRIKQMKTKWGSCNIEAKRIWLNLELAKKPVHCLEYILVHEMTHLLERRHTERFLKYLEKYFSNWKKVKMELNKLPIELQDQFF